MGSKYIRICSVDEERIRQAFGSSDRKVLNAWLRAIRKRGKATQNSEEAIEAEEEAAEEMVAGNVLAGEREDGDRYGAAFLALCEAWSDDSEVVECAIAPECPPLERLAGGEGSNPFGVPNGPYGIPTVYYHEPSEITELRLAFAAARSSPAEVERYIVPDSIAAIERVLGHAQQADRGVIVFYLG
jgi:hypothetical protein